ncbi:hypothetical protein [Humibacter sp.]|uniref:hypothetical protein n=1 Tax=Humibacter sp. TaxID=1940291 RepID=UPI002CADB114|nr:hypothetical protein [Humibacter sp.]HVX09201.1 hypothetical protein [Humibacter sp.]
MANPQPLVTVKGVVAATKTVPWENAKGQTGVYAEVMIATESAVERQVEEFPAYLSVRVEVDDLALFSRDREVTLRCTAYSGIVGGRAPRFINGVIYRPVLDDIAALRQQDKTKAPANA